MAAHAAARLPAFLKLPKNEIHGKFVDLEWQQRNRLLQGSQQPGDTGRPTSPYARLTSDTTAARNRYVNVEPFAQNRVRLRVGHGENDYINASPIQLGKRQYIATQGPKDTSVNHFYRMLLGEIKSPIVVVMLTQTHEAGREKCFQYYPLSPEETPLIIPPDSELSDGFQGRVELKLLRSDNRSRSDVRKLKIVANRGGSTEEKDMYHLLFSGWPDFLVPEGKDRTALIELVRLSAGLNRPGSSDTAINTTDLSTGGSTIAADLANTAQDNPRVIHCSAGVGRSGTFIALDYLLSLMHAGELDNLGPDQDPIADTVDLLRQQRMMMVQGEQQFLFLYDVMREQMLQRLDEEQSVGGATANGA